MSNPVLKDGEIESFTLKVGGKSFQCQCGCNVFFKPDRDDPEIYKCNSCDTEYASDQRPHHDS